LKKNYRQLKKKINLKTGHNEIKSRRFAKKLSPKRNSKNTSYLRGGAVIGSGTSGYVISPALPCFTLEDDISTMSSKIIFFGNSKNETGDELLRRLREIDPSQKMFIYSLGPCTNSFVIQSLNEENKKDIKYLQSRNVLKEGITKTDQIQFFNMKKASVINWKSILQNSGIVAIKKMLDPTLKTYLQLLHDNGIVHNDVKEDNIMMGLEGTLRLVDFGQSQMNFQLSEEDFDKAKKNDMARVDTIINDFYTKPVKRERQREERGAAEGGGGARESDEESSPKGIRLFSFSLPPSVSRVSIDEKK